MANKSTLDNVLQSVLAIGNKDANQQYAPKIYSLHINAVTSFLLDKLVEIYPSNSDVLLPFIKTEKIGVSNGRVKMPDDYRNLLSASISVKADGSDCSDSKILPEQSFKNSVQSSGCKTRPITIVSRDEWDYRTTSGYAFPTVDDPIGVWEGGGNLKVCPYNISKVEINYIKNESVYKYGYILQPDDTYLFNKNTSTELEWGDNAFQFLVKGVLSLYSAYLRDNQLTDYSRILNNESIF